MPNTFDLIILGGGSGGIATANRAAEYGAKVLLIETNLIGGTCVNVGCVPKKIMWVASQRYSQIQTADGLGFTVLKPELDWQALVEKRQAYIHKLHAGYEKKLNNNKVVMQKGTGRFHSTHTIEVNDTLYSAPHILIATGSQPVWPEIPGYNLGIDSDGFFALKTLPKRVAIVGAGYIAAELAGMLHSFGCSVSWVYRSDRILKNFDAMLSKNLLAQYQKKGINLYPEHTPRALKESPDGLVLACENQKDLPAVDCLIWAIGRQSNIKDLQLEKSGILVDKKGLIQVDAYQNTSIPGIYALGDVASTWQLTPVAIKAGRQLAERLFNHKSSAKADYSLIPTVVFSHPPIATIGMSEAQARIQYPEDIKCYEAQFTPMVEAFSTHPSTCCLKLITLQSTGKILGCHMIGEQVDEILQGFAVAIKMGATKADLDETIAIHPTIAEELVTLR
ncbi:MAG: glutathione-disulfide reductase [Candidatus Berkiella sp.]